MELYERLQRDGFEPVFCASEQERVLLPNVTSTPLFATIDDLACYLYESQFFIGNNLDRAIWPQIWGFRPLASLHGKAMRISGDPAGAKIESLHHQVL